MALDVDPRTDRGTSSAPSIRPEVAARAACDRSLTHSRRSGGRSPPGSVRPCRAPRSRSREARAISFSSVVTRRRFDRTVVCTGWWDRHTPRDRARGSRSSRRAALRDECLIEPFRDHAAGGSEHEHRRRLPRSVEVQDRCDNRSPHLVLQTCSYALAIAAGVGIRPTAGRLEEPNVNGPTVIGGLAAIG